MWLSWIQTPRNKRSQHFFFVNQEHLDILDVRGLLCLQLQINFELDHWKVLLKKRSCQCIQCSPDFLIVQPFSFWHHNSTLLTALPSFPLLYRKIPCISIACITHYPQLETHLVCFILTYCLQEKCPLVFTILSHRNMLEADNISGNCTSIDLAANWPYISDHSYPHSISLMCKQVRIEEKCFLAKWYKFYKLRVV